MPGGIGPIIESAPGWLVQLRVHQPLSQRPGEKSQGHKYGDLQTL